MNLNHTKHLNRRFSSWLWVTHHSHLLVLAFITVVMQLLPLYFFPEYGYFRDELYFIACAKRLAFGYVDHPPFATFLLRIMLVTFGDSLLAIRILPALAGAATVFITGRITARLGGGRYAQFIAALAMAISPAFLVMTGYFSMNAFETLIWSSCIYLIIILLQNDTPRLWLPVGALTGIGLLNKHTFIVFVGSMFLGLLLTPARKYVMNKWFWFGGMIAGIFLFPNIIWQIQHDFVSLEFYRNATLLKNIDVAPLRAIFNQILAMNPAIFPLWSVGLCYYLFFRPGKPYRFFGFFYVFLLTIMILSRSSRPDRMLAAYPVLLAAGTVCMEKIKHRKILRMLQTGVTIFLLIFGIGFLPLGIPILPPALLANYMVKLGVSVQFEKGKTSPLPQWYADRFGWEEMVSSVADVYSQLPDDERPDTIIFGSNYGEAGAIEFFGDKYDLPQVISPQNNYHLWGYGPDTARTYITIGISPDALSSYFKKIEQAGKHTCTYCMNRENNLSIYVCRNLKHDMKNMWAEIKNYQ